MKIGRQCFFFLLITSLFLSGNCFSQSPSIEKTLAYINKTLSPKCKIDLSHGKITAQYFDDSKTLIREDKVDCSDLDHQEINYDPKGKVFFIPCKYKSEDCVYRKMFVTGNSRYYPRISFVLEGKDASVSTLKKAFLHLLQSVNDSKYKGTITLE